MKLVLNYFRPSINRVILTIIAISVYNNTYSKTGKGLIGLGIIPVVFFPSFYLAYMYIFYPENFNYKNKNPTIPETGLINEMNKVLSSRTEIVIIFIILYLLLTSVLYKKTLNKIWNYLRNK